MSIASRYKPADSKLERRIITGMIVSDEYLKQVRQLYKPASLKTKFTKMIAEWCIEYFDQFKCAPARHIQDIFHQKTKTNFPEDLAEDITDFLLDISEEYESADTLNIEYLLRQTENQFRLNVLDEARVQLGKAIMIGDPDQGEAIMKGYERITREQTKGIDVIRDKDGIISTFSDNQTSGNKLIRFPGHLGDLIGDIEREHLIAFVGNSGVGKTWWLLQCAWWCVLAGYDVLYVSFEMSESQVRKRTFQWLTGQPTKSSTIYIPEWDCLLNQSGKCYHDFRSCKSQITDSKGHYIPAKDYSKSYKPCIACKLRNDKFKYDFEPTSFLRAETREGINLQSSLKMRNMFERSYKRAGVFDFIRWPGRRKTIDDLEIHLANCEDYHDKIYDIIITDYASKMKPSQNYRGEPRHGINEIFIDHKSLAQKKNCLVITAHQGNTVRDDKDLERGSWQEAIGGINELDIGILINQKQKDKSTGWSEKSAGIYRMSCAKQRDEKFDSNRQIYVLSCLDIGRPYIDSYLK